MSTTSAPSEAQTLEYAHTIIAKAKHLNELIFMAGESLSDRAMANAFTTGADTIDDLLCDALTIIALAIEQEGGPS